MDDVHFEYIRLDAKNQEQIHWDNALKWAQETLICRETFKTVWFLCYACSSVLVMQRSCFNASKENYNT